MEIGGWELVKEVLELAQESTCQRYGNGIALAVSQAIEFCQKDRRFDGIEGMLKLQVAEVN